MIADADGELSFQPGNKLTGAADASEEPSFAGRDLASRGDVNSFYNKNNAGPSDGGAESFGGNNILAGRGNNEPDAFV